MVLQIQRGDDKREVAERLRAVADMAVIPRVVLLAQQPDVAAQREQTVEQPGGLILLTDQVQRVDQPEAACQERALAPAQAVRNPTSAIKSTAASSELLP